MTSTVDTGPRSAAALRRSPTSLTAITIGAMCFLVSFAASWVPSFWGDEATSLMSAERPLSSLFPILGRIDAVHGLYYLFRHGRIGAFAAGGLPVRLPSALAVGVAGAGTVVLADLLVGRRVAVLAGLIFAILPRVQYMGGQARSSAIVTAIGVWATILLVRAIRVPSAPAGGSGTRR